MTMTMSKDANTMYTRCLVWGHKWRRVDAVWERCERCGEWRQVEARPEPEKWEQGR